MQILASDIILRLNSFGIYNLKYDIDFHFILVYYKLFNVFLKFASYTILIL